MAKRVIILFLFFIFPQAKFACSPGWVQGITADKCIRAFSELAIWEDAEAYCQLWGGHLASVANAFENAYIAKYASLALNTSSLYWLGGNTFNAILDPYVYNWTWSDGMNMTYNRFAPNQFCIIYNECCLTQSSADQLWYIKTCQHDPEVSYPYVCEQVAPTTIAPPTTTPWPGLCPTGWEYFNLTQKCYLVLNESVFYARLFNETRDLCRNNFGGDLVSIHSKEENEWITNLLYKQELGLIWIGLYDPHVNGNWQWTDGTPVDYRSWGENQPKTGTYCAYLLGENVPENNEYKYLWYSDNLDDTAPGICALPAKGSPTQPTQKPTTPQWSGKCDPGWQYYDLMRKCYKILQYNLAFTDCRIECQHVEADLATIHSAAENELLSEFIVLSSEDEQALLGSWIGLYSPNNDGEFQWIDGTPLNFTAWSAGEPKTGANGAMLMTQGADRGKWSSTLPKYAGGCFCAKNSY